MKLFGIALPALVAIVTAHPPSHAQRHAHGLVGAHAPAIAAVYVPAPVETVVVYELNGHLISEDEVRQGIANGSLLWGDDGSLSSSVAANIVPATQTAFSLPSQNTGITAPVQNLPVNPPVNNQASAPQSSAQPQPTQAQTTPESQPELAPSDYNPVNQDGDCPDCNKEFPNRQISCGQFPLGYGALSLSNEGLGGWTGVQLAREVDSAGFNNIWTAPTGACADGGTCCLPGSYCSYGCPNPYLKASFPKMQGATGQSVGGLYCNPDGMLEMADGSLAKTLCMMGSTHARIFVQNKLSQPVSICRTDYPGTESMTIPLTLQPGQSGELANPDLGAYYTWEHKATSAQYYINNKGVSEKDACTWGSSTDGTKGNWAPVVLGTSFDPAAHMGYSSLFQNTPTNNDKKLDFSVTFTGDGVNNPCSYKSSTQVFCNSGNCDRNKGCTASIQDGKSLTIVLSD